MKIDIRVKGLVGKRDDISRLRIFVDASRVPRCKWCGISQSYTWKTTKEGVYCSDSCMKVDMHVTNRWCWFPIFLFFVISALIGNSIDSSGILGSFSTVMIPLTICLFIVDLPPLAYKTKVPRNSRVNEGLLNLSLLKTITSHIKCPNCDGHIDLSNVKKDMVYHCDYCGADGIIELVKMKQ